MTIHELVIHRKDGTVEYKVFTQKEEDYFASQTRQANLICKTEKTKKDRVYITLLGWVRKNYGEDIFSYEIKDYDGRFHPSYQVDIDIYTATDKKYFQNFIEHIMFELTLEQRVEFSRLLERNNISDINSPEGLKICENYAYMTYVKQAGFNIKGSLRNGKITELSK